MSSSLYSCGHLSRWIENQSSPKRRCPFCCYIPERHRGFFRTQLPKLEQWDEVMKEMKCQCHMEEQTHESSYMTTHSLPFHLDMDWTSDSAQFPFDSNEYCPCVMEGRLREECRSGCKCNGNNYRYYGERFPGSKVKRVQEALQKDKIKSGRSERSEIE